MKVPIEPRNPHPKQKRTHNLDKLTYTPTLTPPQRTFLKYLRGKASAGGAVASGSLSHPTVS